MLIMGAISGSADVDIEHYSRTVMLILGSGHI